MDLGRSVCRDRLSYQAFQAAAGSLENHAIFNNPR